MLISKEDAAKLITTEFRRILFNKDLREQYIVSVNEKSNMPTGDILDYLTERIDLNFATPFTMFALSRGIDDVRGSNLTESIFTGNEIRDYQKAKMEDEKVGFPIMIHCLMVASNQWIAATDVSFLMSLRNAQLINYNVQAQRTMKEVVRKGNSVYRIAINRTAVDQITEALENGDYIPNTITLNIPDDEYNFSYDTEDGVLVIRSLDHFDISDGYHRFLAMSRLHDENPDFNYPMELRITNFPDVRVRQFIYQEDQKTKMSKLDSDSMNMTDPCNILVERLNGNILFELCGQISRNNGRVDFADMANVIRYFYYGRGSRTREENARFIRETSAELVSKLNAVITQCDAELGDRIDFEELMLIFYCITRYDIKEATHRILNAITRLGELDHRAFATRRPRKGLLKDIEKITEGVPFNGQQE